MVKKKILCFGIVFVITITCVLFYLGKFHTTSNTVIEIYPLLTKNYSKIETIIEDSSLIVYGSVTNVKSIVSEGIPITIFTFSINETLKGSASEEIYVKSLGGNELYSALNSLRSDIKPKKTYEIVANGVKNPKIGDKFLLFLFKSESSEEYSIVGSSLYGRFIYDNENNTFYRLAVSSDPSKIYNNKPELNISLKDLKDKIKNTPDKSAEFT